MKDTCIQSENNVGAERKDFQDPKLNSHLGFANRNWDFQSTSNSLNAMLGLQMLDSDFVSGSMQRSRQIGL